MEFEEKIKKMLQDTCKGLATQEEMKTAVAEAIKEKFAADEFLKNAQATVAELKEANESLSAQVKQLMRSRFTTLKTADGSYNGIWGHLETAKNFGLFIMSDILKSAEASKQLDELGIERRYITSDNKIVKAVSGTSITAGGALVPTEFMPELIVLLENYGVFRRNAQEWPMASDSSVAAAQTSDVVVYAPGAGTQPTESSPGFKNIGLNSRKMMTLTAIDSEMTEDLAVAVGEVVGRSIVRAFAKMEDQCGFIGDGTSTYFNFTGAAPALLAVDATPASIAGLQVQATAGAWSAIVRGDILALPGKIMDEADDGSNCKWYCHRNFYYTVMLDIALGLGGTSVEEARQTGWTPKPRFLGRPVEFTNVLPRVKAAADHIPLLLANLKLGSLLGDRRALQIDQSKEAYFKTDQTGIRGTERIAINNHGVGDTSVAGPIVGLLADIA